jgi:glyoxylase I family protein
VVELGPDVALVTYRALRYEGRDRREVRSLRSSLWKRTAGDAWKMVFHQGMLTSAAAVLPPR